MKWSMILMAFVLCTLPTWAELNLEAPELLIQRASEGKNQLRDVINDLDQNLTEMRDQSTFERYFYLLDKLQSLAVKHDLDSIYPNAVKKLGHRMVQKGVNWLNLMASSEKQLLYYHKWMMDPQPAFAVLNSSVMSIRGIKDQALLVQAAEKLEKLSAWADLRWPSEMGLRLLYRTTLSNLTIQALRDGGLNEDAVLYWLGKVATPEAMSEVTTNLQGEVYDLRPADQGRLLWSMRRLRAVHNRAVQPGFGMPENLGSQIGDTAVDLLLKSLRYEIVLSDEDFDAALGMMRSRHLAALGGAWASTSKVPNGDFGLYYLRRAKSLIQKLNEQDLRVLSNQLRRVISRQAAAIMGRQLGIEGAWTAKDERGVMWRLVIIFASRDLLFASYTHEKGMSMRPYFRVIYDEIEGGFIATEREADVDRSPNLPLRFSMNEDGSMNIQDLMKPSQKVLHAKREQSFPDLFPFARQNAPMANGTFVGKIKIPGGKVFNSQLVVTIVGHEAIGNLRLFDRKSNMTMNYGSEGTDGILYLTRGHFSDRWGGTWMHLRARILDDGSLRGYMIYGNAGLVPYEFHLKKINQE